MTMLFMSFGQMHFGALTFLVVVFLVLLARVLIQLKSSYPGHVYYKTYRFNAIVLTILLLVTGGIEVNYHMKVNSITNAVQELTGNDELYVECQRIGDTFLDAEVGTLGYVSWGNPDKALLKWRTCDHLQKFMLSDKSSPTPDQIVAVHILTHEARHQLGTESESKAECEAIQRDYNTALILGADAQTAYNMVKYYYDNLYPNMPTNYKHQECTQSGLMDETPEDAVFPFDEHGVITLGATMDLKTGQPLKKEEVGG